MKTLSLVRHAKSSWKDPALPDRDRPLNKRGLRDAPRMGRRLVSAGLRPGIIVSSPALRARLTAETIAGALGYPVRGIALDERLYEDGVAGILAVARELDDGIDHALLFGHNPSLTIVVNHLTGSDLENVPTCGVVHIRLQADSWSALGTAKSELVEFDYPKRLDD